MAKIDEMTFVELFDELKRRMLQRDHGFDFDALQSAVREWSDRNFGSETPLNSVKNVLGVIEEVGELTEVAPENAVLMIALGRLSHHHLKELQGIRGTSDEHLAKIKDAIGDIIVYLADYCGSRGFALQDVVEQTWRRVSQRDWKKNKLHGGDVASAAELAKRDDFKQKIEPMAAHVADGVNDFLREAGFDEEDINEPVTITTAEGMPADPEHRAVVFGIDPDDAKPPTAVIDATQLPTPEEEAAMLAEEERARRAEAERGYADIPF